ncbi:MAG: MXAN_6577-like cysteine-rich protein [Polyangiales bacterium]
MALGCATQALPIDEGPDPVEDAGEAPDVSLSFDIPSAPLDTPVTSADVPAASDAPSAVDVPAAQDVPFTQGDVGSTSCELGTVRCGGQCVDLRTSPSNCGRCDLACPPGRACVGGFCDEPCAAPRLSCGGACTDPSVDPSNCGACGNACPAGSVCLSGRCNTRCAAGQALCGGQCVDTSSSALHCGACDSPCPSGSPCSAGRCVAPTGTGAVGDACARGADCQPGWFCQPESLGWPAGYCVREGCARDSDCGPAGVCLIGTVRSACFLGCTSSTQCRSGYACVLPDPRSPQGVCYPSCVPNVPLVCGEYACNTRTQLCTGGCSSDLECSNNSVCLGGDCYCTSRTNCGANRRCYTADGYCGCANDAACGPDARCDTLTGDCVGP